MYLCMSGYIEFNILSIHQTDGHSFSFRQFGFILHHSFIHPKIHPKMHAPIRGAIKIHYTLNDVPVPTDADVCRSLMAIMKNTFTGRNEQNWLAVTLDDAGPTIDLILFLSIKLCFSSHLMSCIFIMLYGCAKNLTKLLYSCYYCKRGQYAKLVKKTSVLQLIPNSRHVDSI